MEQLPPPPVPAEVELRDFQFMPLDVARLRRSKAWLICKRRPELAFYMVNLWTAAWHDTPAGSLEDDDDVLADLAMCPPNDWGGVKTDVLRGWIKCSDGRLYHNVVVEKVLEAWRSKLVYAHEKECDRLRKAARRAGRKDFVPPTFEEWDTSRKSAGQTRVSSGQVYMSTGKAGGVVWTSGQCPPENALKGQVSKVKGQGDTPDSACPPDNSGCPTDVPETPPANPQGPDSASRARDDGVGLLQELQAEYPAGIYRQGNWILGEREAMGRLDEGETRERLRDGCRRYRLQCEARGIVGTQYVMGPDKFFARGRAGEPPPYLDPFPLPAERLTATEELLANLDRNADPNEGHRVFEHEPDAEPARRLAGE